MKGIVGWFLLPLLACCTMGRYVDGGVFVVPVSPLTAIAPPPPVAAVSSMSYMSPYDMPMPYGPQVMPFMPPPSPFGPPPFPSPYGPQVMPFMPPPSPFMPGYGSPFGSPYGPPMMPLMPPPSPFMPGYGPQVMPWLPPASPIPLPPPGMDMLMSPLMAYPAYTDPVKTAISAASGFSYI